MSKSLRSIKTMKQNNSLRKLQNIQHVTVFTSPFVTMAASGNWTDKLETSGSRSIEQRVQGGDMFIQMGEKIPLSFTTTRNPWLRYDKQTCMCVCVVCVCGRVCVSASVCVGECVCVWATDSPFVSEYASLCALRSTEGFISTVVKICPRLISSIDV